MSLEQMYTNRREQFINRAAEKLVKANGTTAQIISDGESQVVVALQDEPQLTAAGMDPALITDVKEILGAYSWIASLCDTKTAAKHLNKEQLNQLKTKAFAVRKELFRFGKFGCKRQGLDAVLAELKEIIEGFGDEDLTYDMLKLYHLYTNNPTITDGLPLFDPQWVPQSLEIHNELRELRADVKNPAHDEEIAQLEQEVRLAYDLLHEKIYELREWGEFVFEGTDRANQYKSEYLTRRYK